MSAFWFHYNKPASARRGSPVLTVHHKGVCHLVSNVVCSVPVRTRTRSKQPRVVMAGRGSVRVVQGTAFIDRSE
jgi:hypothetical protein